MADKKLTHIDEQGRVCMVDVGAKEVTHREARAEALVSMQPATLQLILAGGHKKGDVLSVARIAGIQAAKKCSELIPLCHPLALSYVELAFDTDGNDADENDSHIRILARCKVAGQTGVEMEALTAAAVAALTIYDMCKAVDSSMLIAQVRLVSKSGGQSGTWHAAQE